MDCIGVCQTPRFWFFKEYYDGPPKMNCVTSIKKELAEVNGVLGYTTTAISVFTLLLIFTICGICKSKDYCFQKDRSEEAVELVDIEQKKGDNISFDSIG